MHRVLVTGATGFIGQQLVQQLLAKNVQVRALVRDRTMINTVGIEVFQGDLAKPDSLQGICENIDSVFHLAGHAHAWAETDKEASQKHRAVNLEGTRAILNQAIIAGVQRLVYFSTIKAAADSEHEVDEDFQTMPHTAYGLAKREAERLVLSSDLPHVCVIRPTLVYGSGVKGNLANMLKAIDRGYFLPIPEMGNRRSMVSLFDVCRAALLAAEVPAAHGQVYIVSDGLSYSSRAIYDAMREALGLPKRVWSVPYALLQVMAKTGDWLGRCLKRRFLFDSQALNKLLGNAHYSSKRIQHDLGFQAQQDLSQVLPTMVQYYRNNQR